MGFMDILQAAALIVPVLTLVFYVGVTFAKLNNIEKMVTTMLGAEAECKKDRERIEESLHTRITDTAKELAHVKGRLNGHGH